MFAHFSPDRCSQFKVSKRGDRLPSSDLLNDRYRLLKVLGVGGFGRTFLAIDEWRSPVKCVVKQLLPGDSSHRQKTLTLFHQEAQNLAKLGEHPQIPKLLNTFEQDEETFIVQEWIDGWTLEQEMANAVPFDEVEVRKVLQELLPVLQYLHDRQIVHRDIKPANIIRRKSDRQLVLVDFGAAKQIADIRPIHTGTMIGSVEYAAPEQIKGQAVFASDLYSLGVTCLYLLTQVSPFDLYDIFENDWKWQAYLPYPISSELKNILCKLLQPAVRRRYQSATEVLTDLSAISIGKDAIANPPSSNSPPSDLNLIASFVQKSRSISGATIYLPQTQNWYYLPSSIDPAFSPQPTAVAIAPPIPETPLFFDHIPSLKTLPCLRRMLIVSISAASMACLVLCLGIIIFALSDRFHSGVAPTKDNPAILKRNYGKS